MRLTEYQEAIKPSMAYSPVEGRIDYHALALGGEVGEACNKIKKHFRGDFTLDEIREDLIGELGGVCWYATALCNDLSIPVNDIWGISPKAQVKLGRCGLTLIKAAGVIADCTMNEPVRDYPGNYISNLQVVACQQVAKIYSYTNMIGWWLGGVNLGDIMQTNLTLITDRRARGVIHGNGDHR